MSQKPVEFIEIEVDGKLLSVPKDEVLLWSLRERGLDIPHFCAHKWLEPFAGCRMCLVEIEMGGRMMPKLQPSCAMKPAEGMKVFTTTDKVIQNRREQIEFHLINHPLECPICDKGGECMLQDQVYDHGADEGRYSEEKRIREDKIITDYIRMNYKRCIQCKRCVHFCQDIDGSHLIKFVDRGAATRIEGFPQPGVADRFSGNTIDMCPVGALTARSTRFFGRPWEQEYTSSVGSLDSVGANIHICARLGEVARIIPRDNLDVENGLIDDVTRFSWEHVDDERRLTSAIVRRQDGADKMSRHAGEEFVAERLAGIIGEHGPDSVGVIAGGNLNLEEYLALRRFCRKTLNTSWFHFGDELTGNGPDRQALTSFTSSFGLLNDIVHASTVFSIGCDMFEEAPPLGLRVDIAARRGQLKLLSARSHGSDCDRFGTFSAYGYGNQLRFVRGLANAVSGRGEAAPESEPFVEALKAVGDDIAFVYGAEIWQSENPAELVLALEGLAAAVRSANPDARAWLCPVYPQVNSVGALVANWLGEFTGRTEDGQPAGSIGRVLDAALEGKLKALLIVDADLLETYCDRNKIEKALAAVNHCVYVGPFETSTACLASAALPLGSFAHRTGSVLSMEWRLQARERAVISSSGPSVTDVVNGLASVMGKARIAETETELLADLTGVFEPMIPDTLPPGGLLVRARAGEDIQTSQGSLPAEVKGTAEEPFVLVPKRFLYNDRQETRFSPVFDRIDKPFAAYANPLDLKVQNLEWGEIVSLSSGGNSISLKLEAASWVRPGSIVVNGYCLAAPANKLAGAKPALVTVRRKVEVKG